MSDATDFSLDGHPAAFVKAKADVDGPMIGLQPGMILYGAQTCAMLDKAAVCWNVLSSEEGRLSHLLAGKVSFDGRPGQAWSPSR